MRKKHKKQQKCFLLEFLSLFIFVFNLLFKISLDSSCNSNLSVFKLLLLHPFMWFPIM